MIRHKVLDLTAPDFRSLESPGRTRPQILVRDFRWSVTIVETGLLSNSKP